MHHLVPHQAKLKAEEEEAANQRRLLKLFREKWANGRNLSSTTCCINNTVLMYKTVVEIARMLPSTKLTVLS